MKLVTWCLSLLLALGLAAGGRWQLLRFEQQKGPSPVEVFNLPPGRVLRSLSLGWYSLSADLLFIRANVYYGHHVLGDEKLPWLDAFIDTLLDLDPDFRAAYFWSALVAKSRGRIVDSVPQRYLEGSTEILKRGYRRFPGDYRFPMRIGFNYYYEMGQLAPALPYFEKATRLPGAPRWLKQKLADLYNKRGRLDLARRIIEHLVAQTDDPLLSRGLRDRLRALLERPRRRALLAARRALVEQWQRDYPYVSFDLFLAIKP